MHPDILRQVTPLPVTSCQHRACRSRWPCAAAGCFSCPGRWPRTRRPASWSTATSPSRPTRSCATSRRPWRRSARTWTTRSGRALALLSDANYRPGVALALMYSGLVAIFTDRLEAASELLGRCAGLCRELGMQALGTRSLQMLGIARLDLGDLAGARNALADALSASVDLGDRFPIPVELAGFAGLAASTGRPRLALRLAGAAEACIAASQSTMPEPIQVSLNRWLAPARRALGAAADQMLAEGRRMTVQDAVAAALANEPEDGTRPGPRHALTRREQEVAEIGRASC